MNRPVAYEGKEPYIYVSYSFEDVGMVLPMIAALQQRGFRVWYDAAAEGSKIDNRKVEDCTVFLGFMSEDAWESKRCSNELDCAIEGQKQILIIYFEQLLMSASIQMMLSDFVVMSMDQYQTEGEFLQELCRNPVLSACCDLESLAAACKPTQEELEQWYQKGKAHEKKREYNEAAQCFSKAAEHGHPQAQADLGRYYYSGRGVVCDYAQAMKWCRLAVEQGQTSAGAVLGDMYCYGFGVPEDGAEALKWYCLAFENGDSWDQYNLGEYYYSGELGVEDEAEAVKWYQKSAWQGNVLAQCALGDCYRYGVGVPKDERKAVEWYMLSAEQEHALAAYNLGVCYEKGIGVEEDLEKAVNWYRIAASDGDEDAQQALERLGYDW